ncbi:histone-fold-containing protein [Hysterangium stoloniferum]|nr:histone-fold-containing protein [Hysterangium stoloniferum]
MPRRPAAETTGPAPSASQSQQDASSEGIEDIELPRMIVAQLAKSSLPTDVGFDDDTITALIKGSTVFINYLTAAAQEIAASRAHKTISGADVLKALEALEFSDLAGSLQGELDVFRQAHKGEKSKSKVAPESKGRKDSISKSGAPSVGATLGTPNNIQIDNPPVVERNASPVSPDIEMHDAT